MDGNIVYLIPLLGIGLIGLQGYLTYKGKRALIEKGMDPALYEQRAHRPNPTAGTDNPSRAQRDAAIKVGLLFIGVALGILAGYGLKTLLNLPAVVAYPVAILTICGLVLIFTHKSDAA